MDRSNKQELEDIEMHLLLETVYQHYGYDFRDYAPASLKRRIAKCIQDEKLEAISELQERVLSDRAGLARFLNALTVDVTSLFRDPGFYMAFRTRVIPFLRTYPFFRIWHAGCASGEEVYSTAILLLEEGLYDKARLYATDINETLLKEARAGIYPLRAMKNYTRNYQQAGGRRSFSEYYTAKYDNAIFSPALQKNIVWAQHNLVTDASFNEFQVIVCRNVMIYFNRSLQGRVHTLLYESLVMGGFLCLGSKESIDFTPHKADYETVDERQKIYRRIR
jgi:chemotaxis protein methyltransferase CheR